MRAEVSKLNSELVVEELLLNMVKKDSENLRNQVSSAQQSLESASNQIQFVKSVRENFRSSLMLNSWMRKFVEKAEPTYETQMNKARDMEAKYQDHLKMYEENPTYQAILAEEAAERELRELVTEKHNETMRLDAQREF